MINKTINGLTFFYREFSPDEQVIKDTITDNIFFEGFPEYKIKPNHIVFDIGAHIGAFSLLLSSRLPKGKVFAFEPCLETFEILEKNIEVNSIENILPFKVALTDYVGETKLYYDVNEGNWGHSITKAYSEKGEVVPTDTLNNFFQTHKIEKCDFMKFNCEGAEFKIILSTPKEALKKIDTMLVLYHMDLAEEFKISQLVNHLKSAGFYTEIRNQTEEGKRGWLIVMRVNYFQKTIFLSKIKIRKGKKLLTRIKRKLGKIIRN